ncbi:hypothetical protein [Phytoactinopolyspora halotolerans]|uniref:Uncharacterized protein n=1 Tax=Phytoactinopolyspora halotolerans TaxID=1981512 RepID=A0A6L9SB07_9ACTN|nr:hypothetical protein [Phytoactinopolyspora halotolerans]NEE01180.1 hypothetical protein [Phytoactinopolyspora halotolerans]
MTVTFTQVLRCGLCQGVHPHDELVGDTGRRVVDRAILVCRQCGYVTTRPR